MNGTRDDFWNVTCPDGSSVSSWIYCSGFTDWTRWHSSYYDATGAFLYADETVVETEEGDEDEGEEESDDGADYYGEREEDDVGTPCWSPGDWAGFCVHVDEFNIIADNNDFSDPVPVPSQCIFYADIIVAGLEAKLLEIAAEYPRTTCVTAIAVATGATLLYAKMNKRRGGGAAVWVVIGTNAARAYMMDVYL